MPITDEKRLFEILSKYPELVTKGDITSIIKSNRSIYYKWEPQY